MYKVKTQLFSIQIAFVFIWRDKSANKERNVEICKILNEITLMTNPRYIVTEIND